MPGVEIQDLILKNLYEIGKGFGNGHFWISLHLFKEIEEKLKSTDDLKLEESIQFLYNEGFINMIGIPLRENSLFSLTAEGSEYIEKVENGNIIFNKVTGRAK